MTLQEAEGKLSELNNQIDILLKEREAVLKEWIEAFNSENPENIYCEVENIGDVCYKLYLVNGSSKMQVCTLNHNDMKCSTKEFYKRIDTSMSLFTIANGTYDDIKDFQKNLVYAKAIEIKEGICAAAKG